jgi:hypothetical protein
MCAHEKAHKHFAPILAFVVSSALRWEKIPRTFRFIYKHLGERLTTLSHTANPRKPISA